MSNKFWAQDDSDESDTEGEQEIEETKTISEPVARNKFLIESDSDSDEETRTVKTKKDKTMDSLHSSCRLLRSYMNMKAWQRIKQEFINNGQYSQKYVVVTREPLPRYYIRLLCDLECLVEAECHNKESLQKLSKLDAKCLKQMKLIIKKHNGQYTKKIAQYKLDPDTFVPSEDELLGRVSDDDDDQEDDDEEDVKPARRVASPSVSRSSRSSRSSSSSSSRGSSSSSSTSSSSESDSDGSSSSSGSSRSSYSSRSSRSSRSSSRTSSSSSRSSSRSSTRPIEKEVVFDFSKLKGRVKWLKSTTEMLKKRKKAVIRKQAVPSASVTVATTTESNATTSQPDASQDATSSSGVVNKRKEPLLIPSSFSSDSLVLASSEIALLSSSSSSIKRQNESQSLLKSCCRISTLFDVSCQIKVLSFLASTYLSGRSLVKRETLKECCHVLLDVCRLLHDNSHLRLVSAADEVSLTRIETTKMDFDDDVFRLTRDEDDAGPSAIKQPIVEEVKTDPSNDVAIIGNLCAYFYRIRFEVTNLTQTTNHHVREYLDIVQLEPLVLHVYRSGLHYYQRIRDGKNSCQVALMILERLYCFHESVMKKQAHLSAWHLKYGDDSQCLHPSLTSSSSSSSSGHQQQHPAGWNNDCIIGLSQSEIHAAELALFDGHESLSAYMNCLTQIVYANGDEKSRATALLYHVYHLALDNDFNRARSLLLMSRIQDGIENMDKSCKILYNRSMAVLGISAFRHGYYSKCCEMLANLCGSGKARELMAQGSSKQHDKDSDQDKEDKKLIVPYHMQINLDLLDACYHVSSLITDLPTLIKQCPSLFVNQYRLPPIAKFLKKYDGNWNGIAESCRDHIVSACQCLQKGDYDGCMVIVTQLTYWDLVPSHDGRAGDDIRSMLGRDLRREACRAFVTVNARMLMNFGLSELSCMYQLTTQQVTSLLSEMICRDEIEAYFDNTSVHFRQDARRQIDVSISDGSERLMMLTEANERLLQARRIHLDQTDQSQSSDYHRQDWSQRRHFDGNNNNSSDRPTGGGGRFGKRQQQHHRRNDNHGGSSGHHHSSSSSSHHHHKRQEQQQED